ncbi:MAG: YceI family protein [Flavobacteriales bacterium]|nr:YceI family protein [Flavobacteriales bacterium]
MKKNTLLIAAISVSVALASCAGGGETAEVASEENTTEMVAETATWTVDGEKSNIRWTGGTAGATVYSHFGDINVNGGSITTEGDKIATGNFAVDMTSIAPKDNGYSEESPMENLVGHLASPEFFNSKDFPESSFEITSAEGMKVMGNLTIRGNSNAETIEITNMTMNEDGTMTATGTLVFDRQKYDVAWEHFLKDTVLSDDIKLEITLVAKKA